MNPWVHSFVIVWIEWIWRIINHMELTVSKVNEYIKNMFELEPGLNNIRVKGEVSNCKYHISGHIYFTIKDAKGQLSCVMFAGSRASLKFRLEEGQNIIVSGRITVYERDGKYQMYARQIEKDGMGSLYEQYEQLKKKLDMEGLFNSSHKKPIPRYAAKIGVVTAKGGAALQDIVNISTRRNPYVQLYLCPVLVQGEKAAADIAMGIKKMDEYGVDIIIVARGGGSIEDLWAFNEEVVARACYNCVTPVISGVGHETDTTIIDYVADLRAPTPSAAAEIAVFAFADLQTRQTEIITAMNNLMAVKLGYVKSQVANMKLRLEHAGPVGRLEREKQYCDNLYDKLFKAMNGKMTLSKHRLAVLAKSLEGLSPLKKLSQGYSYVTDINGNNINSVTKITKGDDINIHTTDGLIFAQVKDIVEEMAGGIYE